jgi:hypothetical protein
MNVKTRLFSIILLGILIIPVFFNPPKSGKVLGVSEQAQPEVEAKPAPAVSGFNIGSVFNAPNNEQKSNEQKNVAAVVDNQSPPSDLTPSPEYKLKDISSGIRDKKKKNMVSVKDLQGKVVWDAGTSNSVTSDKFGLGSGVKVKYADKVTNLVVANTRILAPDVLLLVDSKTFVQLGGDLEKQASIDVIINIE